MPPNLGVHGVAQRRVLGADRAGHRHPVGDHVVAVAALDRADRDHDRRERVGLARRDVLQREHRRRRARDHVDRLVRVRAVTALAANRQVELVGGGVDRPGVMPIVPVAQARVDVQHRRPLRPCGSSSAPASIIGSAPPGPSSAGWNSSTTVPCSVARDALQYRAPRRAAWRCARRGRRRASCPAPASACLARVLGDRQRVHVGAQPDDPARQRAAHDPDHARSGHPAVLDAQRVELALDDRLRVVLLEAELGMAVDLAPNRDGAGDGLGRKRGGHRAGLRQPAPAALIEPGRAGAPAPR